MGKRKCCDSEFYVNPLPGLRDQQELRDLLPIRERLDQQEIQDLLGLKDLMVLLRQRELQDQLVQQVLLVQIM